MELIHDYRQARKERSEERKSGKRRQCCLGRERRTHKEKKTQDQNGNHKHTHTQDAKAGRTKSLAVGSSVRLSVSHCIIDNSLSCFDLSPAHQKVECTFHITRRVQWRWKQKKNVLDLYRISISYFLSFDPIVYLF